MGSRNVSSIGRPVALAAAFAIMCAALFVGAGTAYAAGSSSSANLTAATTQGTVVTNPEYGDDAVNTDGTANIRTVYRFGWVSGGNNNAKQNTVSNLDVTGDGWADKIKVVGNRTSATSGYLKSVKVTVNGKTAATYANSSNKINRVVVSVVTLKNKRPFLWVSVLDGKGNANQRMLMYEDGSFTKVFSNKGVGAANTSNHTITSITPEGNKMYVWFSLATSVTGLTHLKYTYAWSNGWLERTSRVASKLSYATGDWGQYTRNKLTAAGSFKVYTNTSLKKVKFTVPSGKKVTIQNAAMYGKKLLYKVKYGKKTGWISCPTIKRKTSKSPYTLFYETYGKVNLKSSIPSYAMYKYFTTAQLQMYNDHSLYVARNEIYARNGYKFTNGELRGRFVNKKWYPRNRLALNRVEVANVDLISSIENNRSSLYAA